MSAEIRGGVPRTIRLTAANSRAVGALANAEPIPLPFKTKYLQISNEGANAVRVYWTVGDFNDDVGGTGTDGFIELPATTGYFEGPVEAVDERVDQLFLRGVGGTADVVVTAYQKLA
jgi:hypothetical protein